MPKGWFSIKTLCEIVLTKGLIQLGPNAGVKFVKGKGEPLPFGVAKASCRGPGVGRLGRVERPGWQWKDTNSLERVFDGVLDINNGGRGAVFHQIVLIVGDLIEGGELRGTGAVEEVTGVKG